MADKWDIQCIIIVRKIQNSEATDEDMVWLWNETCKYIRAGIRSRAWKSKADPCMSIEDISQEIFIRLPSWAKSFPKDMDCYGRWIRSCWWRFCCNLTAHHARHRPMAWLSVDRPLNETGLEEEWTLAFDLHASQNEVVDANNEIIKGFYDELCELIDLGIALKKQKPEVKELFKQFLHKRTILGLGLRKSKPKGMNIETCRELEMGIINLWKAREHA